MRKNIFYIATAVLLLSACNVAKDECKINGTIRSDKYEGVKIFVVPLDDESSEAVDSVEIHNRKFQFVRGDQRMASIRLDYHHRDGIQELLVVLEPGNVNMTIDSISHGGGTPQNDSLQVWKELTEKHNGEIIKLLQLRDSLDKAHHPLAVKKITEKADSLHNIYKRKTLTLAENLKSGTFHDFLIKLYPKTK